jgi:multidrug efflux pump subunit AcrA (membrane-fusion protein)
MPKFILLNFVSVLFLSSNLLADEASIKQNEILLTGKVVAGDVQNFTVPWSQTWRQQIKWMKPEGEMVEEGDLVVLFDTSNLTSQIEQEKVSLRQSKDKAMNEQFNLEQKLIDAEHAVIKAELEFDLAKLLADVPAKFRSELDDDNIKFDLKKAKKQLEQSNVKLVSAESSLVSEKLKQALESKRIAAVLNKKENDLEKMQLKAARKGAVLHAEHPWNGSKISEGQSVQTSWNVASIPGVGNESVKAWVNEVDWPRLNVGQHVTMCLDAFPNEKFTGKIKKIGLQAESKSSWGKGTYYDVEIEVLEQPTQPLIPGMSVLIEVNSANNADKTAATTDITSLIMEKI